MSRKTLSFDRGKKLLIIFLGMRKLERKEGMPAALNQALPCPALKCQRNQEGGVGGDSGREYAVATVGIPKSN